MRYWTEGVHYDVEEKYSDLRSKRHSEGKGLQRLPELRAVYAFVSKPTNFNRAERRKRIFSYLSREERLMVQDESRLRILRRLRGQEGPREIIPGVVSTPHRNPERLRKKYR